MSMRIFDAIKLTGLPRCETAVIKELAIFADDNDVAWPSNETLAKRVVYSVRGVQDALEVLEDLGLIKRINFYKVEGKRGLLVSRKIRLLFDNWKGFMSDPDVDEDHVELSDEEISSRGIEVVKRL